MTDSDKKCCHGDGQKECFRKPEKRACCESQVERLIVGFLLAALFGYIGWKVGGYAVPVFKTHAYVMFLLSAGAWAMCFLCIWRAIWPPKL